MFLARTEIHVWVKFGDDWSYGATWILPNNVHPDRQTDKPSDEHTCQNWKFGQVTRVYILQLIFSTWFSSIKIVLWCQISLRLFVRVQLTMCQHWLEHCHYLSVKDMASLTKERLQIINKTCSSMGYSEMHSGIINISDLAEMIFAMQHRYCPRLYQYCMNIPFPFIYHLFPGQINNTQQNNSFPNITSNIFRNFSNTTVTNVL